MSNASDDDSVNGHESPQPSNTHRPSAPPVPDNSSVPKPKRLACMICRKRKLKCDGVRPSCSTCSRLGHSCAYDEQRRKSGPKRGYVKALEERLKHVETLLKSQDAPTNTASTPNNARTSQGKQSANGFGTAMGGVSVDSEMASQWQFGNESPQQGADFDFNANITLPLHTNVGGANFTWEMIGLGLEEPLPPQETIDELHQIFFEKVHPTIPMIHKYRYLAAMNLAPTQRPPVCLRYAMWTLACSVTDRFSDLKDLFYQRARKYVEADYVKGYGEHMISVAHAQTHALLANYEMKMMYFPRAWINTGSAVRLSQMIGLHRLDGQGLDVKQCLPPPKDWTEVEERRRTFWMAFCEDRYASIGTGWPMTIDEQDILTNLPASEEAFEMGRPEQTSTLANCTSATGVAKLSSFGGIILLACLFGRNLLHLHRPDADELDHDTNGPFWKRHRQMDNILLNTSLCLPSRLKLPTGISNPNVVFTNMSIHTSTICLHQAAIFKAEKNKLPTTVSAESKVRCITAANEIASIMRTISHMDLSFMHPFVSFCLYVSARVLIQYLKSRPDDSQTADSLHFLVSAMNALKRRNPLSESFLVQLDVDFEALAQKIPKLRSAFPRMDDDGCHDVGGRVLGATGASASALKVANSYRNDCHFLKTPGDNGSLAEAPDLVDRPDNSMLGGHPGDGANQNNSSKPAAHMDNSSSSYSNDNWAVLGSGISVTPDGTTTLSGSGRMSGIGDVSAAGSTSQQNTFPSPDTEQPNGGPAPNSGSTKSTESEHALNGQNNTTLNNMSYSISPKSRSQKQQQQSQHRVQNIPFQSGVEIASHDNPVGQSSNTASFYGNSSGFTIPTSMVEGNNSANSAGRFSTTNSWPDQDMHIQTSGLFEGGEGMLRSLMNMGQMDAMDLGSWDTSHDNSMLR